MTATGPVLHAGARSVIPLGYERLAAASGRRPTQPRALTPPQQRAQATRPDLWPVFSPPPNLPPLPARRDVWDALSDDELDALADAVQEYA